MSARIYSPSRTAMQSGKARTGHWILEFAPQERHTIEPLMGYTSSSDMNRQILLRFDTREEAIAYAKRHGIEFHLQEPKEPRRRPMSYAENFHYNRRVPWTH